MPASPIGEVDVAVLDGSDEQRGLRRRGPADRAVLRPDSGDMGADGRRTQEQLSSGFLFGLRVQPRDKDLDLARGQSRAQRPLDGGIDSMEGNRSILD